MPDIKKVYDDISSANMEYRSAIARNAGISAAKDRVKNLLFNYRDDILSALHGASASQREIDRLNEQRVMLEDELAAVDDENNDLRKKVRELESAEPQRKRKTKTMTAVVE